MNDTLKKLLVVVSLTILIWTWAYLSLAKNETYTGSLEVSPAVDPALLVTLSLKNTPPLTKVPLTALNLKGAPSQLGELLKRRSLPPGHENEELLDFYYAPQQEGQMEGTYTLDLADYIQKSSKIHDLALTLQSCIPSQIDVTIEKLVEKELPVECVDIEGLPLKGASANPSFVTVYIKKDSDVESAKVVLSPQLIETAKKQPVEVTAYVELGVAGVRRKSKNPVLVSLQSEKRLRKYTFQPASFGFITSPKVAENFIVELIDETFTDSTSFMATNKAMEAYKKMQYHVLIEIRDEDASLSEILPRPVIYNFPPKDFKNGDIDIVEVPIAKTATFKLTPRNPTPN